MAAAATLATLATLAAGAVPAPSVAAQHPGDWHTVLTTKDVDGDGRDDVVRLRKRSDTRCAVRVRTATGVVDTRVVIRNPNPCQWHGAAPVDSVRGVELSVLTTTGAHAQWHSLLTWRDGGLVVLRSPSGGGQWVVDASAAFSVGVKRRVTDNGPRVVTFEAFVDDSGETFSGTRRRFAYRGGSWIRLGSSDFTMSPERALRHAGWHVAGLPRWVG